MRGKIYAGRNILLDIKYEHYGVDYRTGSFAPKKNKENSQTADFCFMDRSLFADVAAGQYREQIRAYGDAVPDGHKDCYGI